MSASTSLPAQPIGVRVPPHLRPVAGPGPWVIVRAGAEAPVSQWVPTAVRYREIAAAFRALFRIPPGIWNAADAALG